jgi:hypothetical protein
MTINPESDRWQEIKDIWKQNQWLYAVAGFFAGLIALPFLQTIRTDFFGFLQEFVPEAAGIGFTVFIVDRIYRRRDEKRAEEESKARLIQQLGSRVKQCCKESSRGTTATRLVN